MQRSASGVAQAWSSRASFPAADRAGPCHNAAYPAVSSAVGRVLKESMKSPSPEVELRPLADSGRALLAMDLDVDSDAAPEGTHAGGIPDGAGGCLHEPSRSLPWSSEEASQLRRAVKRVIRRGIREKEALWLEVSREHGNGRAPRECKLQYTRDYKAHKASAAGSGPESHPPPPRRAGSNTRGRTRNELEPEPAVAAA